MTLPFSSGGRWLVVSCSAGRRPEETAASYDRIAGHWDGEGFNRENGIAQHRRALRFVAEKGVALDVGCGSSGRIIDLLVAEGFEVEGLDVSAEMLRLARARHPDVRFHHADICEWVFPRQYNFLSAWDSVWHVPLEDQERVFRKLCDGLRPQGVLIFTTGGLERADHVTNPCHGQPLYTAGWAVLDLLRAIEQAGCVCRHLEFDQFPEKHLVVIVEKKVC